MGQKTPNDWYLDQGHAQLAWNDTPFYLDASRPNEGLSIGAETRLFRTPQIVVKESESIDLYARGKDLIAKYPSTDERPVGAELYWRWTVIPSGESTEEQTAEVGTIEFIYSLETQFLDTQPDPQVHAIVHGNSIRYLKCTQDRQWQLASASDGSCQGCLVDRDSGQLLMVVIPDDVKSIGIQSTDAKSQTTDSKLYQIDCLLNSDFLEKGVIRRLRLFAVLGPPHSEDRLISVANDFLNSELPLTT